METPTSSGRPLRATRTATPRLSERKKKLFTRSSSKVHRIDDDDGEDPLLSGIAPLAPTKDGANQLNTVMTKIATQKRYSMREHSRNMHSNSSSPETNKENKNTRGSVATIATVDEQLPLLFTSTMRINSNSSSQDSSSANSSPQQTQKPSVRDVDSSSGDDDDNNDNKSSGKSRKRPHTPINTSSPESSASKQLKTSIPTVAFYSKTTKANTPSSSRTARRNLKSSDPSTRQSLVAKSKVTSPTTRRSLGINKGVGHKIRKPTQSQPPAVNLDCILSTLRNDKLRQLITSKREERAKIEQVHQILRNAENPIQMAKPLSVIVTDDANNNNNNNNNHLHFITTTTTTNSNPQCNAFDTTKDFSDLSDDDDGMMTTMTTTSAIELEPIIPLIKHDVETLSKRKFFKSGQRTSTSKEVRITHHIRASVTDGKIALMQAPAKKFRGVRVKSKHEFAAEQATVDAILRNLDDSVVENTVPPLETVTSMESPSNTIPVEDPYKEYWDRLPYNTEDPSTIEQQRLLLEFLITNSICTEENFIIFIADPDNHKDEATRIVDDLYMIINAEEQESIAPPPPLDPQPEPESLEPELPPVIDPTPKLFPIFSQRLQPIPPRNTRRKVNVATTRLALGATGANQYQIDAGQKAYGAKQCMQCGLVYTVHEPEEEQLHREYHNSVHVLRFKGWIDEDIVSIFSDWGSDGRIIRITDQAPAARLERLTELIKVVDKELGYSSYIMPKTFVAFFAIRKQQIVGLCLVQPLTEAYKFMRINNTDYCSEETFDASCGISRLWIAPLHRRRGIATKLMRAVQSHTVLGQEIPIECIAFSSPSDDGRAFAQHLTKSENFLTYL